MLRPVAVKVEALENYQMIVTFDNDEIKIFDVKPYIKGTWYGELADKNYFRGAFVNGYTVEWPNGQDICPDELYYCSIKMQDNNENLTCSVV